MNGFCGITALVETFGHAVGVGTGAGEYKTVEFRLGVNDAAERFETVGVGHFVEYLLGKGDVAFFGFDGDGLEISHELLGDAHDFAGHG